MYAIKRLLHHFVRHLLNRWGLISLFCSADALHIFLCQRPQLLPIFYFLAKLQRPLKKNKIPSAAPQTVWRRGGAFRWQSVSVTLISAGMRKTQSSFLNSNERKHKPAAAAKNSTIHQRCIRAALACTKKTNDRFAISSLINSILVHQHFIFMQQKTILSFIFFALIPIPYLHT